jgi:hypothetical protein
LRYAFKKTYMTEKLNNSKGYPKVEEITGRMSKKWATATLVIPANQSRSINEKRFPEEN